MILVLSFMVKLGLSFAQYRGQRLKSALEHCAWDENLLDLWLFARSDFDAPARSQSRLSLLPPRRCKRFQLLATLAARAKARHRRFHGLVGRHRAL